MKEIKFHPEFIPYQCPCPYCGGAAVRRLYREGDDDRCWCATCNIIFWYYQGEAWIRSRNSNEDPE